MARLLTLVSFLLVSLSAHGQEAMPSTPEEAESLARRVGETTWGVDELLFSGKVAELTVSVHSEELDEDGNVTKSLDRVDRVTMRNGQQHRHVLQARQDGRDATEEVRKQAEEHQRQGRGGFQYTTSLNLPFAATHLGQHRFSVAGADPQAPNRLRLRFAPRSGKAPTVHQGEALVDATHGQLVQVRYQPTELPRFADKLDVRMDFRPLPGMGQVLDTLRVEYAGGAFFIRKRGRVTVRYSDVVLANAAVPRPSAPASSR